MPSSPEADPKPAVAVSPFERDIDSGLVRMGPDGKPYTVTTWATVDLEPAKRGSRQPPIRCSSSGPTVKRSSTSVGRTCSTARRSR